jgi:hypothetical protein
MQFPGDDAHYLGPRRTDLGTSRPPRQGKFASFKGEGQDDRIEVGTLAAGDFITIGPNVLWEVEQRIGIPTLPSGSGFYAQPFSVNNWGGGLGCLFYFDGKVRAYSKGSALAQQPSGVTFDGTPFDLKVGFDGTYTYVEIDGSRVYEDPGNDQSTTINTSQLVFGNGSLNNAAINIYWAKLTVGGVVHSEFDFNAESGLVLYDKSGNERHGEWVNPSNQWQTDATIINPVNSEGYSQALSIDNYDVVSSWASTSTWLSAKELTGDFELIYIFEDASAGSVFGVQQEPTAASYQAIDFGLQQFNGNARVWKNNSNSDTAVPVTDGSIVKFTRSGSTVTMTADGVTVDTFTDSGTLYAVAAFSSAAARILVYNLDGNLDQNDTRGSELNFADRIIPAVDATTDALGNTLQYIGNCPFPVRVDTPCFTGDGGSTYIDPDIDIPNDADVEFEAWIYPTATNGAIAWDGDNSRIRWYLEASRSVWIFYSGAYQTPTELVNLNQWNHIKVARVGNDLISTTNGVEETFVGAASNFVNPTAPLVIGASNGNTINFEGQIAEFKVTINGVTKTLPIQDGAGRDTGWYASDGTKGVIPNAIVGGNLDNIWANRCPGLVKDHCLLYGGGIDGTTGAFVLGDPNSDNDAVGNPKTLVAAKHGNPYSRLFRNPFSVAELTADPVDGEAPSTVVSNPKFSNIGTDGTNNVVTYASEFTGQNLANLIEYLSGGGASQKLLYNAPFYNEAGYLRNTAADEYHALSYTDVFQGNGSDVYIDLGDTATDVTSVSCWVKQATDNQVLFTFQNSAATGVSVVAGVLTFGASLTVSEIKVDGSVVTASAAGTTLNDNEWHKLELTLTAIDASDLRLLTTTSSNYADASIGAFEYSDGSVTTRIQSETEGTTVWLLGDDASATSVSSAIQGTLTNVHQTAAIAAEDWFIKHGAEFSPQNLLQYSETFNLSPWGTSLVTVTTDFGEDENGDVVADRFAVSASGSNRSCRQPVSLTQNQEYTAVFRIKPLTTDWVGLWVHTNVTSVCYFDVTNGTVGTTPSNVTASITPVSNGYYDCKITFTPTTATGNKNIGVLPSTADGGPQTSGDAVLVSRSQLYAGSDPVAYFETQGAQALGTSIIPNKTDGTSALEGLTPGSTGGYLLDGRQIDFAPVSSVFSAALNLESDYEHGDDREDIAPKFTKTKTVSGVLEHQFNSNAIRPIDDDVDDYIARVTAQGGTVSTATQNALRTFSYALIDAGIRDKIYRLNALTGNDLAAALVPFILSPATGGTQYGFEVDQNVGPYSGGDWSETTGLTRTVAEYLDTGMTPDDIGTVNQHLFYSSVNAVNVDDFSMGATPDPPSLGSFDLKTLTGNVIGRSGGSINTSEPVAGNNRMLSSRVSSTDLQLYFDGTSVDTDTLPASTISDVNFLVSGDQFDGYSIGLGLTAGEVADFDSAWVALQRALGR